MELAQLVNAYETLAKIKTTNELPFQLAWKFADVMESMETHYKRYNDERTKIITEFGKANGDGSFQVEKDKLDEFQNAMEKLLLTKVDFKVSKQLELTDLLDSKIVIDKDVNIAALKLFISGKTALEVAQGNKK